jgi:hypothetical protein
VNAGSAFAHDSGAFPTQPITRQTAIDHRSQALDPGAVHARTIAEPEPIQRTPFRRTSELTSRETGIEESASDRRVDAASTGERRLPAESPAIDVRRDVVAPQPLFNGLLMISLVANVYLIFWLKNLRLQFRDLVAAKRMASTNSP